MNADPALTPPDERDLPPPPNASTSIGIAANPESATTAFGLVGGAPAGAGGYVDPHALVVPTPRGGVGAPGKARRVGTAPGTPLVKKSGSVGVTPSEAGGGGMYPAGTPGSVDGRSSLALEGGRGGSRTMTSGGGVGKAGSRESSIGGPSHFNTEMEANRLAYVRFLQVCIHRAGCMVSFKLRGRAGSA